MNGSEKVSFRALARCPFLDHTDRAVLGLFDRAGALKDTFMLLTQTNQKTMTSIEIADLVESRHDSVKRTINRLFDAGAISNPPSVFGNKSANGKTPFHYLINERDSYVIVAQISPLFTAKLVDRWQELEQSGRPALPDFSNPVEAARAWADAKEAEQKALEKLEEARPAVEFIGKYVESAGNKTFRQVAKLLKAKEPALRLFLVENKIMYRLGNEWTPYACHIDAGRFNVTTGTKNDHAYTTAKFTPKGVEWIAKLWGAQ